MVIGSTSDDFPIFSKHDWDALVARSLGDRTVADLASFTDDRIRIEPIYERPREVAPLPVSSDRTWTLVQRIDLPEFAAAHRQISEDRDSGAEALELVFASSPSADGTGLPTPREGDLNRLLGSFRDDLSLRIDAGEASTAIAGEILRRDGAAAGLTIAFDPVATLAANGRLDRPVDELVREIAEIALDMEQRGVSGAAIVTDGRPWHAAGASEVQELAAVIAGIAAYLRLLVAEGLDAAQVLRRMGIVLAADAEQFLAIAKVRAARLLVARLAEVVQASVTVPIHAETAWRMMTRRDMHANILRTTIAAFAAFAGGADSVTVLPFDIAAGTASPFARRVARNSQIILRTEAGLDRPADPGAGSGAIEALTDSFAAEAWERFRALEAAGGLLAVVRSGALQREIAATRDQRLARVARRVMRLVGINAFPPRGEAPPAAPSRPEVRPALPPAPAPAAELADPLVAIRLAEPFEALRDRSDALAAAGAPPRVLLVRAGDAKASSVAASDAIAAFATGGIEVVEAHAGASSIAGFPVICIAGPAQAEAAKMAADLKAQGAQLVLLAGPLGPDSAAPSAIDDFVRSDTDLPQLLGHLLDTLATTKS